MENLTIGSFDWTRKEWDGVFYPDDLPDEWRLDFYSNEFHCALVSQTVWSSWVEEDFEDLLESIEGQKFAIYFAIQQTLDEVQQKQLLLCHAKFNAITKGVVFWEKQQVLPAGCEQFSQTLVESEAALAEIPTSTWHWTFEGWRMSGDPLGLVFNLPSEGREQAAMLKSFMASLPEQKKAAPLIIGKPHSSLDIEDLRALKTIAELLGY